MKAVLITALLALLLVGYFAAVRGSEDEPPVGSTRKGNAAAVDALVAFARSPDAGTFSAVPLADEVELGLADRLLRRRPADELLHPAAWELKANLFRARSGSFSALRLLAQEERPLTVSVGPHAHCASPPAPPPARVAALRRVSVQPRNVRSCLQWFTVDLFVTSSGQIRAVTLDLFEP